MWYKDRYFNTFYLGFGVLALVTFVIFFFYVKAVLNFGKNEEAEAQNPSANTNTVSDPLITVVPDEYLNTNTPKISSLDPKIGPDEAKVKVVLFSDFECPYCLDSAKLLAQLENEFKENIQIIWKDAPNPRIHPQSQLAAEAARCAARQGKFWEYHDNLFANQEQLGPELYSHIMKLLGLNENDFNKCFDNHQMEALVQKSYIESKALGVSGTPYFFINAEQIQGLPEYAQLKDTVEKELKKTK